MARSKVTLRLVRSNNNLTRMRKSTWRGMDQLTEKVAAFTMVTAKRSMKRAPASPARTAGRFGRQRKYREGTQKAGQTYWQKGLYSKPGSPPFYNALPFNIRDFIRFKRISKTEVSIAVPGRSKIRSAHRVGPLGKQGKAGALPVPRLHEAGGTVKFATLRESTFVAREAWKVGDTLPGRRKPNRKYKPERRLERRSRRSARYPARPFMRPAGNIASRDARRILMKLGGMRPHRLTIRAA